MLTKSPVLSSKNHLISGLYVLQPVIHCDNRGFFYEFYNPADFAALELTMNFVQDNVSFSNKNVLRGLHFQKNHPQGKLVSCLEGEIFDVAVDLRKDSATFGEYAAVTLSSEKHNAVYIPEGFAHGFFVLSDSALILYKCSDFYHPEDEAGYMWNDSAFDIKWPLKSGEKPVLSEKDLKYRPFC